MIDFGPQIAIVDDRPDEIKGIEEFLSSQGIGFKFYDADVTQNNKPEKPIDSIKLIFLDLYYLSEFDPYLCAAWIDSLIPDRNQYELVVWSKDSHKTDALMEVLLEINKLPRFCITKQKNDYKTAAGIEQLIKEIEIDLITTSDFPVLEYLSEIIDIAEDYVVLNCLVDSETRFFQIRKFEKTPLIHFKTFDVGCYLTVRITTNAGQRLFEFIEDFENHAEKFEQKDLFLKFKDSPLLKSHKNG